MQEYETLSAEVGLLYQAVARGEISPREIIAVLDAHGEPFSTKTMQGLALRKPHGYAGDYEIIDKIYRNQKCSDPSLAKWDDFFHSQHAPKAVRNRKSYFHALLDKLPAGARVLKLGCGPGRSMFEWMNRNPERQIWFDCVDIDEKAIHHARDINAGFADRIHFHHKNVFKFFVPEGTRYDLIWAAGLFDYFDDRMFVALGKRFVKNLTADGEMVIGNFSTFNPTRAYMELIGQWYLHHRDARALTALGERIGPAHQVTVAMEPEMVNLFLHVSSGPRA